MAIVTPFRLALGGMAAVVAVFLVRDCRAPRTFHITACESTRPDAVNILFIGNSHTFVNDLPGMLCQLGKDRPLNVREVVMGGWTLHQHWVNGDARRAIEERHWDFVVLQEQSDRPLSAPKEFEGSVASFDAAIDAAGAQTVIEELWAPQRSSSDEAGAISLEYVSVARSANAVLVPVGAAWRTFATVHPEVVLIQPDLVHARPAGTYLAACTFYAALFHSRPQAVPIGEVNEATARDLESTAWVVVSEAR